VEKTLTEEEVNKILSLIDEVQNLLHGEKGSKREESEGNKAQERDKIVF